MFATSSSHEKLLSAGIVVMATTKEKRAEMPKLIQLQMIAKVLPRLYNQVSCFLCNLVSNEYRSTSETVMFLLLLLLALVPCNVQLKLRLLSNYLEVRRHLRFGRLWFLARGGVMVDLWDGGTYGNRKQEKWGASGVCMSRHRAAPPNFRWLVLGPRPSDHDIAPIRKPWIVGLHLVKWVKIRSTYFTKLRFYHRIIIQ